MVEVLLIVKVSIMIYVIMQLIDFHVIHYFHIVHIIKMKLIIIIIKYIKVYHI